MLDVKGIELTGVDNTRPTIAPDERTPNIARENGRWIRGTWNASFSAASQAGVCHAVVVANGVVVGRGASYAPHTGSWTQCGAGAGTLGGSGANGAAATIDTTKYANGPLSVEYYADDPAQPANVSAPTYRFGIDNGPVSLQLSGPTQALTTDGPQSVTATASAGPSGVAGMFCSVDQSPFVWHAGASEIIKVSKVGINRVSCAAANNAISADGTRGRSPVETWTLVIRKPSVSLLGLVHVADALRCVHRRVLVRVPAHWVTERYHGHVLRVHVPPQTRRVNVERCHPRVKVVWVVRNGRSVQERVVQLPHQISSSHERIPFGARTTVSGWLGSPNGDALGGQTVQVLTAPADGSSQLTVTKTTTTLSNGTWTVRLPAGPSRLVEAVYRGTTQTAPAMSRVALITVPASPTIRLTPRQTRWGDTIRISGRLRGGYVPASGELVVLRIGWKGGSAEIGHVYCEESGRFAATYTFLRGAGTQTYRIWGQTVRESDYPFAPASSRRLTVKVSS